MNGKHEKKILIGRSAIMDFIGITDPSLFYHFIKHGLPARVINRRWYAHAENLENYFQKITNKKVTEIPKDAE